MAAEQNEKSQKKKPFLIIFICIIMIALGLAAGIFISNFLNKSPDRTYDNNAEDIKEKNDDSSPSEEVSDNISIPCWDTLVMTADSTEQEVNFYNPEKQKLWLQAHIIPWRWNGTLEITVNPKRKGNL